MGGQSHDHYSGLDLWYLCMVALLLYTVYVVDSDMGIGKETSTYTGGIQHHLGMDILYGTGTAFDINICMTQYIMPMARNTRTGETVKSQDLSGVRYIPSQRKQCQLLAQRLADQMTQRGQDTWTAVVQPYSV